MHTFNKYNQSPESLAERIEIAKQTPFDRAEEIAALKTILHCIDLTTLEGSDTLEKITGICNKAKSIHTLGKGLPNVAAVCFYPPFAALAKKLLAGTNIEVACVAGAFPAGQSPIGIKIAEVEYAVAQGADEIDMVISRGKFLEGKFEEVASEIAAIKKACGQAHLKVILETGELSTIYNIRKASEIAIHSGADFIKTSTGKIQPAATPEALLVMADTIKDFYEATGKKIGLKPAGGISDYKTALVFYQLVKQTLGHQWLNNKLFRIGASRLTDDVISRLNQLQVD